MRTTACGSSMIAMRFEFSVHSFTHNRFIHALMITSHLRLPSRICPFVHSFFRRFIHIICITIQTSIHPSLPVGIPMLASLHAAVLRYMINNPLTIAMINSWRLLQVFATAAVQIPLVYLSYIRVNPFIDRQLVRKLHAPGRVRTL